MALRRMRPTRHLPSEAFVGSVRNGYLAWLGTMDEANSNHTPVFLLISCKLETTSRGRAKYGTGDPGAAADSSGLSQ